MSAVDLRFVDITFSYNTAKEPIVSSLNLHFSRGWTGIVGPNGAGKSTVAKLAAGILRPESGYVMRAENPIIMYCDQGTEYPPESIRDFAADTETHAGRIRSILGIDDGWAGRWQTLSHGERKRMQIGIALWREPDILILDEPVNHVDYRTKRTILASLLSYDGTGIIVSHDREFLDSLCRACLFMRPGYAVLRRGNFSEGYARQRMEDATRETDYANAISEYRDLKKRADEYMRRETGKAGKLSKKNIAKHDHDAKSRIDAARLTGKDGKGTHRAKVLERRADRSGEVASSLYFRSRKVEGMIFRGERSRSDRIVEIGARSVPLGPAKSLAIPDIAIYPSDRIAITGANGTGKSTLIGLLVRLIQFPPERILYIPQEIDTEMWETVRGKLRMLGKDDIGLIFTAVHRLGSEPDRVIGSDTPSPGEKRKIMLALGLLKKPAIIILDEPTNHMDLPSIQCIEDALRQYDGALVIVSHDPVFIRSTTGIVWEIVPDGIDAVLSVKKRP